MDNAKTAMKMFETMEIKAFREGIHQIWQYPGQIAKYSGDAFYIAILGALIGIAAGAVISIFRITTDWAIAGARMLANGHGHSWWSMSLLIFLALVAGLIVGRLARNPAVPFGGASWIHRPRVWRACALSSRRYFPLRLNA